MYSENDIIQIVNAASKKPQPGRALLMQSYYTSRPLLAIIAACFEDVKPLDCFMQWLCSKCEPMLANIHSHAMVSVGGFDSFDIYEDTVVTQATEEWRGWQLVSAIRL